ncbi:MAG: phosphoglucosamine mutase [Flavobacteriaceae bacterium]|jgi:phosphomannomutase|nr:phosphoglucosamine mutase [Flavobacteriaceae bacterium]MBT5091602.1 phosphoglucosamine mutase [Flavobacteriaceae bacterium]MBT5283857.1 phosphoglucosamine mutase [Flavobacteriaceae bacterium]MBT5447406.1 phosphoglucosamine mutase [Flavobacteriaceae bacterium]MBT5693285.1 phosphoglucosamine mutase [Flavobacteriaceae bacterium]
MTLIKSISGIRGTIGGSPSKNLTPLDVVRFTTAYGQWLSENNKGPLTVVTGRDARISGPMVHSLVNQTLLGMGINVIDLGLSTTPTVAVAVPWEKANGGIILTASHNPKEWNALKLLNADGEFINATAGAKVLEYAEKEAFNYAEVDHLGTLKERSDYIEKHIEATLAIDHVNLEGIRKQKFKVVVDGVNSSGGIAIPELLNALNIEVVKIHCEPNGHFQHNPEPLKENLTDLCNAVIEHKSNFGIAVDPDVDRLVFVDEKGELFGEEYTLVACADYILSKTPGATVSNLSSTRALADITQKHGCSYTASAVGEVNVVTEMKAVQAVIGGEGNGGIIYPPLHYGRDALVGVVLFLSLLVERKVTVSKLRAAYPSYFMSKNKIKLKEGMDVDLLLDQIRERYAKERISTIDGVKIDFDAAWVHLRKSNTEPIIRIYTEAKSELKAVELANRFVKEINSLL